MKNHFRRVLCALLALALCQPLNAMADVSITIIGEDGEQEVLQAAETEDQGNAREAFIDGIIDLAKEKFDEAGGQPQRAHYSGDIYVCKNFTVYLFRENRDRFRMAEYPGHSAGHPRQQAARGVHRLRLRRGMERCARLRGKPLLCSRQLPL